MIKSREFSEIEAGDGLDSVVFGLEAFIHNDLDQLKVLVLVEVEEVLLPELLSMAWSPSQLSTVHLISQLFDRAEDLLVLVKVLKQLFETLIDIVINPMSVLELDDQTERINVGEMLLAYGDLLKVIKEHQHNSNDLLPVEEVKNLGDFLDDGDSVIFEVLVRKLMIAKNPQHADDVVSDLRIFEARCVEQIRDDLESLSGAELLSELVGL